MPFGFMRSGQKLEMNQRIDQIEKAIVNQEVIAVSLENSLIQKSSKQQVIILPLRLVYIDGELEVIGEEIPKGILRPYLVGDIHEIEAKAHSKDYRKNITSQDVIDYIESGRLITENEERLVLKIPAGNNIDLAPPHLYMGNPFAAVNSDGEMIWAATVEVSNPLFEWLSSLQKIEVLDPPSVAIQLQLFLQNNKR